MISAKRKAEIEKRNAQFVAAYLKGEFAPQIAERAGLSIASVSRALRLAGVSLSREERNRRLASSEKHKAGRRRTGDKNTRPVADRFNEKVVRSEGSDECWGWKGARSGSGYPQIRYNGRTGFASHVSLTLDGRPRPDGMKALHTCDNPICTNPRHLWWGTQQENVLDAKAKGRMNLSGLSLGLAARLSKRTKHGGVVVAIEPPQD